jgi:hypothetical protein
MNFSGFSKYYSLRNETAIGGLGLRIVNNPAAPQDSIRATNLDKIGEKLKVFLSKLMVLGQQPTFRWDENSGFVLDSRYSYLDNDLKFIGYDTSANETTLIPSDINLGSGARMQTPNWHGLLSRGYSINTQTSPLAYSVTTYGYTYEGLIAEITDQQFHDNAMSVVARDNVINSINSGVIPHAYVGFRKKVIDSLERNETPTKSLVQLKHEQNKNVVTKPFHNLNFDCYVTKPLTFHGTFVIQTFVSPTEFNNPDITSKYIYESINYTIDKSQNLITANVSAVAQPWTISDLQIKNGS